MHSPIYSQICTGTFIYTTAQTHLKNTCARTKRTYIHYTCLLSQMHNYKYTSRFDHALTHSSIHLLTHSFTHSLIHSLTHSFTHSLAHAPISLSLILSQACMHRHTHSCPCVYFISHTITCTHGLT